MLAKGGCGDLFVGIDEAELQMGKKITSRTETEFDLVGTWFSEDATTLTSTISLEIISRS